MEAIHFISFHSFIETSFQTSFGADLQKNLEINPHSLISTQCSHMVRPGKDGGFRVSSIRQEDLPAPHPTGPAVPSSIYLFYCYSGNVVWRCRLAVLCPV